MGITIDKAIKLLKQMSKPGIVAWDEEDLDAIKMGADAVKKVKSWRTLFPNPTPTILKGEVDNEGKPLRL